MVVKAHGLKSAVAGFSLLPRFKMEEADGICIYDWLVSISLVWLVHDNG